MNWWWHDDWWWSAVPPQEFIRLVLLASTHFSTHQSKTTRFVSSAEPQEDKIDILYGIVRHSRIAENGRKQNFCRRTMTQPSVYRCLDFQPSVLQQILSNRSHAYNCPNGMCDANKLIDIPKYKRSYLRLAQAHGNGELSSGKAATTAPAAPNNQDLVKFRAKITKRHASATHGPSTAAALLRTCLAIRGTFASSLCSMQYWHVCQGPLFRISSRSMIINFMIICTSRYANWCPIICTKCVQNGDAVQLQTLMYSFIFLLSHAFFAALVPILIVKDGKYWPAMLLHI